MTKQKTMQYQKAYTELNEIFKVLSEEQKEVNAERKIKAPNRTFTGSSYDSIALEKNKRLSSKVCNFFLKF